MDTAKLWFMLFCVCGSRVLSLDINCDWTTEYDYKGRCCKACPSGQYPKAPCPENKSDSVCEKCSTATSKMDKCFCKDNHICYDNKCEYCDPRKKCQPGHQLKRYGNFDYTYDCELCPNNTFNDAEDSTCKNITKCDGVPIFPGNHTHNARCVLSETVHSGDHNGSQTTHFFMVACLTVTVLTCLVFVMHIAFTIYRYKMRTKISKLQCTHRMVLPSDTCTCKLSKEEEGEETYSKTLGGALQA